jgi:hypothetical protein
VRGMFEHAVLVHPSSGQEPRHLHSVFFCVQAGTEVKLCPLYCSVIDFTDVSVERAQSENKPSSNNRCLLGLHMMVVRSAERNQTTRHHSYCRQNLKPADAEMGPNASS